MKKFSNEEEKKRWERERKARQRVKAVPPFLSHPEDVPPTKGQEFVTPMIEITKGMMDEMGVKFMQEGSPVMLKDMVTPEQVFNLGRFVHARNGSKMKYRGKEIPLERTWEEVRDA